MTGLAVFKSCASELEAYRSCMVKAGTQLNVSSVKPSGKDGPADASAPSSTSVPTSAASASGTAKPSLPTSFQSSTSLGTASLPPSTLAAAPGSTLSAKSDASGASATAGAGAKLATSKSKPGSDSGMGPPREISSSSAMSVQSSVARAGAASTISTTASQGSVASGPTATAPSAESESTKPKSSSAASSVASSQSGAKPADSADKKKGASSPMPAGLPASGMAAGAGGSAAGGGAGKSGPHGGGAAGLGSTETTSAGGANASTIGSGSKANAGEGKPGAGGGVGAVGAASAAALSAHTGSGNVSGPAKARSAPGGASSATGSSKASAQTGAGGTGTSQKRKQSKTGDNVKKEGAGSRGGAGGGSSKSKNNQSSASRLAGTQGMPNLSPATAGMPGFAGNPLNAGAGAKLGGKAGTGGPGPNAPSGMPMKMPGPLFPGMGGQVGGMMGPGAPGAGGPGMGGGMAPSAVSAGQKQIGVQDALAYLNKVKLQFQDKPEVYNQFLEIMKNFKSQTIDTPGVIQHVCELFKGHDNLILGFNTFLPPGFKIELATRGGAGAMPGTVMLPGGLQLGGAAAASVPGALGGAGPVIPNPTTTAARGKGNRAQRGASAGAGSSGRGGGSKAAGAAAGPAGGAAAAAAAAAAPAGRNVVGGIDMDAKAHGVPMVFDDNAGNASAQGQPVEFDHAINYVTKIKKRFSEETDTYKSFLDILHSYQNEQRSINEVLEQVSNLFKDHPDLLKEFTYFLPDAVRESAKTELARRAAKAQKASQRAKDKTAGRRKEKKGLPLGDNDQEETRIPQLERNLLGRIKAALGTRELWGEFLKCLDLFAQELISRAELLSLVSDILGERADLLEEFDRLLASRGATDDPVESAWFSMPLADIDFDNCRTCTPSYRGLPAAFPKAPCSERTALCRSVLNDTWVSVPFGSEDAGSKGHRRSPNEDALFRTEDDRYEVDLVIDSNLAAIRALEPLAQEIKSLGLQHGESSKFRYRLERRSLSVIHLKSIARIYGDHGTEILELLRRNPAGAIPVILRRLKEKHEEWCRDRQELNKTWKEQMERNYLKSLDHRSFYFKQSEKRAHTQKVLLGELRDAHNAKVKHDQQPPAQQTPANTKVGISTPPKTSTPPPTGTVELDFPDPIVHQHAWGVISLKAERMCEKQTLLKIAAFYNYVFNPLFLLPLSWLPSGTPLAETLNVNKYLSVAPRPRRREDALPDGTKVQTPLGTGTITAYVVESGFYTVALSFGVGHMLPGDVFKATDVNDEDVKTPLMASFSKPVRMEDSAAVKSASNEDSSTPASLDVFSTTQAYCFLRLYHMLYSRLLRIKELCETRETTRRVRLLKKTNADSDGDAAMSDDDAKKKDNDAKAEGAAGEHEYTQFLSLVYSLMNGTLDTPKFEDECRVLLGPEGFVVFTIEKLVLAIQKQLTTLVSDERPREAAELFASVEKPSEAAKAHAARHPDPPVEVRSLAKAYSFVTNALVIPADGLAIRARLEQGELADPNKPVDAPHEGLLPLPKNTLVEVPVRKPSPWSKPPRMTFSFASLPVQVTPPESGAGVVPAPVPVTVVYPSAAAAETVDRAARFDAKDMTAAFRSYVNADDKALTFSLPLYVVANFPASKPLVSTITNFAKEHPDQAASTSITGETWFADVLAKTTAELEADKQAAADGDDVTEVQHAIGDAAKGPHDDDDQNCDDDDDNDDDDDDDTFGSSSKSQGDSFLSGVDDVPSPGIVETPSLRDDSISESESDDDSSEVSSKETLDDDEVSSRSSANGGELDEGEHEGSSGDEDDDDDQNEDRSRSIAKEKKEKEEA
ncbi:Paired amphipathic helix protein Sin3b [Hondaea fermentalgiana]|uniref:Paired amphipathic helix protein Sin3b n=1 Tax=Hondaea fermentalgiana TaxID=2315210 RepID=A0A2R5G965_9STRA|nr:Paired amphipathic helix protein Sin3b [Hondaea fermentalgiana]|eukprot:GBG25023.1 Paired amphipathic helix protein Sin3b [Hondaea fermentalgiana]